MDDPRRQLVNAVQVHNFPKLAEKYVHRLDQAETGQNQHGLAIALPYDVGSKAMKRARKAAKRSEKALRRAAKRAQE